MREIIDIDVEIRTHEQVLRDLHQKVVGGDEIVRVLCLAWTFHIPSLVRAAYWNVIKCKYRKDWTPMAKRRVGRSTRRARNMLRSGSRSM
jgi:hypothetical protein